MGDVFFEVVMVATEFTDAGFESRDEIEDALSETLAATGSGEVTGGGAGSGFVIIEVEMDGGVDGVAVLRDLLRQIGVPKGTIIKRYKPRPESHAVYT